MTLRFHEHWLKRFSGKSICLTQSWLVSCWQNINIIYANFGPYLSVLNVAFFDNFSAPTSLLGPLPWLWRPVTTATQPFV